MIQITCKGNSASCTRTERLTSGMVGLQCEFIFDEAWDGLAKTAVFQAGNEQRDVLLQGVACTVPWEVLQHPGYQLVIGVYGSNADGTLVIPTCYAMCGSIAPGADPSGEESTDPTLPVWGQLQGMIGNLDELETTSKDNLVDAINEAAQSGGGSGVQPDWNQNDVSAPDYVKNRPFYTENPVETLLLEEQVVTFTDENPDDEFPHYWSDISFDFDISLGDIVKVTWDGTEYTCIPQQHSDYFSFGNEFLDDDIYEDTGEPFYYDGEYFYTESSTDSHQIKVSKISNKVIQLDEKYVPRVCDMKIRYIQSSNSFELLRGTYYDLVYKFKRDIIPTILLIDEKNQGTIIYPIASPKYIQSIGCIECIGDAIIFNIYSDNSIELSE